MRTSRFVAIPLVLLAAAGCGRMAAEGGIDPDYLAEIETWHAKREAALATEGGWLSLAGLHPIVPGAQTLGSGEGADLRMTEKAPELIGTLTLAEDGGLALETAPGMAVSIGGEFVSGTIALASDADGAATELELGSLRFYVIARGGEHFLRVKDLEHQAAQRFRGVERFPVEERWRVEARLVPSAGAEGVPVPNVLGQVS